jgi:ABC-2 type transport system ATP-binding protein
MIAATLRDASARPPRATVAPAELRDVWKSYGKVAALAGVSLRVEPGEVVAILGPNGAGKTTAIRVLLGLRTPDRGTVQLFERDPRRPESRTRVGCTPQETGLPQTLRVVEAVEFASAHFPDPVPTGELLDRFGLTPLARRQTGGLSGGERRRLAVALAFVGAPPLVVLDEPSTGLDVHARRLLWQGISAYATSGGTVLLSTHDLDEAEALASQVVVLARGTVLADGGVEEIRARAGVSRIRVRGPTPAVPGVLRREVTGGFSVLFTRHPGAVVRRLVEANTRLDELEVVRASLEEAFLDLTREEA